MLNIRKRSEWDNGALINVTEVKQLVAPVNEILIESLHTLSNDIIGDNVSFYNQNLSFELSFFNFRQHATLKFSTLASHLTQISGFMTFDKISSSASLMSLKVEDGTHSHS